MIPTHLVTSVLHFTKMAASHSSAVAKDSDPPSDQQQVERVDTIIDDNDAGLGKGPSPDTKGADRAAQLIGDLQIELTEEDVSP